MQMQSMIQLDALVSDRLVQNSLHSQNVHQDQNYVDDMFYSNPAEILSRTAFDCSSYKEGLVHLLHVGLALDQ